MCTIAIDRKMPPLKALARLKKFYEFLHDFTLRGRIPERKAQNQMKKIKPILMSCSSFSGMVPILPILDSNL
jgi:hypothetical protein